MIPHSHTEFPTRRAVLHSGITLLGGAAITSSGVALANECVLTPSDILGPMYNYGAPMFQKKLAMDDEPGERLILTGTVYSSDCRTPLPAKTASRSSAGFQLSTSSSLICSFP